MEVFIQLLGASLITVFVRNLIFGHAIGADILMYAARRKESLLGFFFGITVISTLAGIAAYFLNRLFGDWGPAALVLPLIYIVIIGIIYSAVILLLYKYAPKLFGYISKYAHLSVFNCAVVGALFLNTQYSSDLIGYIFYGIATGVGFLLASLLLSFAEKRLQSELVPAAFRGIPIILVYIGVIALSLYAFTGYATTGV